MYKIWFYEVKIKKQHCQDAYWVVAVKTQSLQSFTAKEHINRIPYPKNAQLDSHP